MSEGPLVNRKGPTIKPKEQLWCAGCAKSGHLAHSCTHFRSSFPPTDPSVKSYDNVYVLNESEGRRSTSKLRSDVSSTQSNSRIEPETDRTSTGGETDRRDLRCKLIERQQQAGNVRFEPRNQRGPVPPAQADTYVPPPPPGWNQQELISRNANFWLQQLQQHLPANFYNQNPVNMLNFIAQNPPAAFLNTPQFTPQNIVFHAQPVNNSNRHGQMTYGSYPQMTNHSQVQAQPETFYFEDNLPNFISFDSNSIEATAESQNFQLGAGKSGGHDENICHISDVNNSPGNNRQENRKVGKNKNKYNFFSSSSEQAVITFVSKELKLLSTMTFRLNKIIRKYAVMRPPPSGGRGYKNYCKSLNMALFGIRLFNEGQSHLSRLKSLFGDHPKPKLSHSKRKALFQSYNYIFGEELHEGVDYQRLLKRI